MAREIETVILEKIQRHAVSRLTPPQSQKTNLSFNPRVFEKGEQIGPPSQRITLEEAALVVFADDDPMANWGHPCRYLLYDPHKGELRRVIPARMPIGGLKPFHRRVEKRTNRNQAGPFLNQIYRCPAIIPGGKRYALLYAGFTMEQHLNDLEFCYRTLVNVYAIPPENITVLSFDGTLSVVGNFDNDSNNWIGSSPAPALWPADNQPYQIVINGPGTLSALTSAFAQLAGKLGPDDLLFIHTSNHGDYDLTGLMEAFLFYPESLPTSPNVDWTSQQAKFYASAFGNLLQTLPPYRALIVMMEQCGSGGFALNTLISSTAADTSFAAACDPGTSSYANTFQGVLFDTFAYQWIAAMAGEYPDGSPLLSNPDTDGSLSVTTSDAFNYAVNNDPTGYGSDTPNLSYSSPKANQLVLAETGDVQWMWCTLYSFFTKPYQDAVRKGEMTKTEFQRKLNKTVPLLQKMILSESGKSLVELRHKLAPEIAKALEDSFKK